MTHSRLAAPRRMPTTRAARRGCGRSEELRDSVDVLFIDEAGQMSLADVLAVAARRAQNLVFLGDPQQLEQPQQGEPSADGAGASALEHILGGAQDHPRGLRHVSRRDTAPAPGDLRVHVGAVLRRNACRSFARARPQSCQRPDAASHGAGLVYVPVAHEGNQSARDGRGRQRSRQSSQTSRPAASCGATSDGANAPLDRRATCSSSRRTTRRSPRLPSALPGVARRHRRQVSGPGSARRDLSMTTSAPEDAPRGMSSCTARTASTSRPRARKVLSHPRRQPAGCSSPTARRRSRCASRMRSAGISSSREWCASRAGCATPASTAVRAARSIACRFIGTRRSTHSAAQHPRSSLAKSPRIALRCSRRTKNRCAASCSRARSAHP